MKNIKEIFNDLESYAEIIDCSKPAYDGDIVKKQKLYFGCNYQNIPTVIIRWSEKGRGFGEYTFQLKDGKMICDNEGDSKETVKRILCLMVDQCEFLDK